MGLPSLIRSKVVRYLRETSSVAGLSHAAKARSLARRIYWLVLFLLGLFATLRGLVYLLDEIGQYPVVTSSKLTTRNQVPFPAVTICNANRVHCPALVDYVMSLNDEISATVGEEGEEEEEALDEARELLSVLVELAEGVDCVSQTCQLVFDATPSVRSDRSADLYTELLQELDCHNHKNEMIRGLMCYYLYQTMYAAGAEEDEKALSAASAEWQDKGCDLLYACAYVRTYLQVTTVTAGAGYEITEVCFGDAGGEDEQSERKKRNATWVDYYDSADAVAPARSPLRLPAGWNESAAVMDEDDFLSSFMALDDEVRRAIGHQFDLSDAFPNMPPIVGEAFVRKCTFQGGDCSDLRYWLQSTTPAYGNCYTYNAAYNELDPDFPRHTGLTGATNGLILELFLDQVSYMTGELSPKAGARVVVHASDEHPAVVQFGMDAQPGTAGSISMQMNDIERLPYPYPSNCYDDWEETDLNASLLADYLPRYSLTVCLRACLQILTLKTCDCFDSDLDLTTVNVSRFQFEGGRRTCSYLEEAASDTECINGVLENFENGNGVCSGCHLPCREISFNTAMTSAVWPSDRYWISLARELGFPEYDIYNLGNYLRDSFQRNYVKVSVYFQTLNVREVVEFKKYTLESSFAAVGGSLSLYLGVAIIMLFEAVELTYDVLVISWNYFTRPTKVTT